MIKFNIYFELLCLFKYQIKINVLSLVDNISILLEY